MLIKAITPALLLTIGFVAGSLYASTTAEDNKANLPTPPIQTISTPDAEQNHLREQIDALRDSNEQEANMRIRLEEKIAKLEKDIATLYAGLADVNTKTASVNNAPTPSPTQPTAVATPFSDPQPDSAQIEQSLLAYGFAPEEIKQLRAKESRSDLDQLYLRDQAIRENWINTPRYRDELEKLATASSVRESLNDKRYDQYLYASGQFNRVIIDDVIPGSAAEHSGIRAGDTVLSYNGERIFNWDEIRTASTQGNAGEMITIEIERNGAPQSLTIARGPLGVHLNMDRVDPGP